VGLLGCETEKQRAACFPAPRPFHRAVPLTAGHLPLSRLELDRAPQRRHDPPKRGGSERQAMYHVRGEVAPIAGARSGAG
jgi:hypothetical protein